MPFCCGRGNGGSHSFSISRREGGGAGEIDQFVDPLEGLQGTNGEEVKEGVVWLKMDHGIGFMVALPVVKGSVFFPFFSTGLFGSAGGVGRGGRGGRGLRAKNGP